MVLCGSLARLELYCSSLSFRFIVNRGQHLVNSNQTLPSASLEESMPRLFLELRCRGRWPQWYPLCYLWSELSRLSSSWFLVNLSSFRWPSWVTSTGMTCSCANGAHKPGVALCIHLATVLLNLRGSSTLRHFQLLSNQREPAELAEAGLWLIR